MTTKLVAVLSSFGFILGVAGCYDRAYPPFLRNGFDSAITVNIVYSDGVQHTDTWLPGMRVTTGREGVEIVSINVWRDGRVLHRLDEKRLQEMKNSVNDVRKVTWNIQTDGIRPITMLELQRLDGKE